MELKMTNDEHYAYALGYYHGRAIGEELNPFKESGERHLYTIGYERGISDYCFEYHNEEVNT